MFKLVGGSSAKLNAKLFAPRDSKMLIDIRMYIIHRNMLQWPELRVSFWKETSEPSKDCVARGHGHKKFEPDKRIGGPTLAGPLLPSSSLLLSCLCLSKESDSNFSKVPKQQHWSW